MDFNNTISRIAKDIQATMFNQQTAHDYLVKAGYADNLQVEDKDRKRIEDMNVKANGDYDKYFSLVNQMAKSIRDPQKAYRRGTAMLKYSKSPKKDQLASIFFEKAISLG